MVKISLPYAAGVGTNNEADRKEYGAAEKAKCDEFPVRFI